MMDRVCEYISAAPAKYRQLLSKVAEGTTSPRQAIKAKCLDCSHFQRAEVRDCTVCACPLHRFRPYQLEVEA
jgi:hypothetical protein